MSNTGFLNRFIPEFKNIADRIQPVIITQKKGALISRNIPERKGYKTGDAETVALLVEEHLLLVKAATRRDINDGCPRMCLPLKELSGFARAKPARTRYEKDISTGTR